MMEPLSRIYEIPRRLESLLLVLHSSHLGQAGVDKGLLAHRLCCWRARCGGDGAAVPVSALTFKPLINQVAARRAAHHGRQPCAPRPNPTE